MSHSPSNSNKIAYLKNMKRIFCLLVTTLIVMASYSQTKGNDVTSPLHTLPPNYPVPYKLPSEADVKGILDRVFHYLDSVTPPMFYNRITKADVSTASDPDTNVVFKPGDFRLTSYEWGVTYSGMLSASEATQDHKYYEYTQKR